MLGLGKRCFLGKMIVVGASVSEEHKKGLAVK
jgi:hypothetical protein